MSRTDVHRPADLVTEDYAFVEAFDTRAPEPHPLMAMSDAGMAAFLAMRAEWEANFGRLSNLVASSPLASRGLTQCHHCGARLRYVAVLSHGPTGQHIAVGETCLDNRFGRATADFQRMRKNAELDRERARMGEKAEAFIASMLSDEAASAMALDADLVALSCGDDWVASTLADIRHKLWTVYGTLTERQAKFVHRLVTEAPAKAEERAARSAEVEKAAPTGRVTFEGVVLKIGWKVNPYNGMDEKKLTVKVTDPDGVWLVWLSCPSNIYNVEKGETARMTATLNPSDKAHFVFGKRPTKASVIPATGPVSSLD